MTVPKGVTVNDLTTQTMEKGGNTFNQYYYNGQFVGYAKVQAPAPTEAAAVEENTTAASGENQTGGETVQTSASGENSQSAQDVTETGENARTASEEEAEGLSSTAKRLLIVGGVMGVLLIALLIALYIKNDY